MLVGSNLDKGLAIGEYGGWYVDDVFMLLWLLLGLGLGLGRMGLWGGPAVFWRAGEAEGAEGLGSVEGRVFGAV